MNEGAGDVWRVATRQLTDRITASASDLLAPYPRATPRPSARWARGFAPVSLSRRG